MKKLRVLIGCEFSGVVRSAFRALGHEAYSCDLLPAEDGGEHITSAGAQHLIDIANGKTTWGVWDIGIFHPPCTYLCNSGVRWLYGGKGYTPDPARWEQMQDAAQFFRSLWTAKITHIAVENPVMHGHAKKLVGDKYAQIIQPWQFGHGETKATCLWLRFLPKLEPTNIIDIDPPFGRTPRVHHASPGPDRWKERSRTLPGIAAAMASQWSEFALEL